MNTISESPEHDNSNKMPVIVGMLGIILIVLSFIIGIADNLPEIILLLIGSFILLYAFLYRLGGTET